MDRFRISDLSRSSQYDDGITFGTASNMSCMLNAAYRRPHDVCARQCVTNISNASACHENMQEKQMAVLGL